MDHPEEMISLILEHYPSGAGREALAFEARETRALMQPGHHRARLHAAGSLAADRPHLPGGRDDQGGAQPHPFLYNSTRASASSAAPTARQERGHRHADLFLPAGPARRLLHLYLRLREEASDRQWLTRELAQREQHYRFVAENSGDVIWTMDTDSLRFVYISPAIASLSGYEPAELFALSCASCSPMSPGNSFCDGITASPRGLATGGDHGQTGASSTPSCATSRVIWWPSRRSPPCMAAPAQDRTPLGG